MAGSVNEAILIRWLLTIIFAVTAGIGFASTNIADATLARASRATPEVQTAHAALADAMAARDRECKGGVGKFCREREAAVNERRQALDATIQFVGQDGRPANGGGDADRGMGTSWDSATLRQ